MALDDLPDWVPSWCMDHLHDEPVSVLFRHRSMSRVYGLRMASGHEVVVKVRPDEDLRAAACVAAQARLSERGFPCAHPLTPVSTVAGSVGEKALAVHAEEYRGGGDVLHGETPVIARRYAEVFARMMADLDGAPIAPPLPNPRWARWDHGDPGLWPAVPELDARVQHPVPEHVIRTATRARARALELAEDLPRVLGHADFEAQNLRWRGDRVWAVHDWDSLAWQPEAALAGAASGTFASALPPTLAPVESSAAFLETYQEARGRRFGEAELQLAWAASLWPAAHNARWEALHGGAPLCCDAVREQGAERLRRAGA
ncbi:hypothetical protein IDM40_06005 [Nocardiopsis sp. HNM0947]|uniref:Aminoglycoside phosphotransferase domain-containing protein n=1 Tax=Nocardiopsis coralli TaxID=2772213 RepID=A0ABR9P347_9ACTN|nr:hypothetical protein [Nocardiopsis coralli]